MQKWAYTHARCLSNVVEGKRKNRYEYYFTLQSIYNIIAELIIIMLIGILTGTFLSIMVVALSLAVLRRSAGGYHVDSLSACTVVTVGQFTVISLIVHYTIKAWSTSTIVSIVAAVFILGIPLLIIYAPKDMPQAPITRSYNIKRLKIRSIIILMVWAAAMVFAAIYDLHEYALASSFGIALELFSVTPAGKVYELANGWARKRRNHD